MGFAAFNDAVNAAMSGGASAEMADAAGRAAIGLVSQGMDPASAVALASMTALGQVGPEMPHHPRQQECLVWRNQSRTSQCCTSVCVFVSQVIFESSTQMGGMGGADSPFGWIYWR
jgi:hypothetical protein